MTLCRVDPYCGKKPGVNNYFLSKKLTPDLYSGTGKTDFSILRHFTHNDHELERGSFRGSSSEPIHSRVLFEERKLEENNSSSSINCVIRAK